MVMDPNSPQPTTNPCPPGRLKWRLFESLNCTLIRLQEWKLKIESREAVVGGFSKY